MYVPLPFYHQKWHTAVVEETGNKMITWRTRWSVQSSSTEIQNDDLKKQNQLNLDLMWIFSHPGVSGWILGLYVDYRWLNIGLQCELNFLCNRKENKSCFEKLLWIYNICLAGHLRHHCGFQLWVPCFFFWTSFFMKTLNRSGLWGHC